MSDIVESLTQAQTACWTAATEQIMQLLTDTGDWSNQDDVIKMLLDERRRIHDQFKYRIDVYEASKSQ